ncbi:MAG: ion channel [Acidobacteriota bacterium]
MSFRSAFHRIETRLQELEDVGLTAFFFILVVLSFGIFPFVHLTEFSGRLASLGFTFLFLAGTLAADLSRRWRRGVLMLALLGAVLNWIPAAETPGGWLIFSLLISISFNLIVSISLLRRVFRPGEINWHRFQGATAVYVLLGFLFALGYVLLEVSVPGSFEGMQSDTADHLIRDAVYFSFVTLTTVGYGDITPIKEAARSLAIVEGLLGQIFLAVLIGRLVTLSGLPPEQLAPGPSPSQNPTEKPSPDAEDS